MNAQAKVRSARPAVIVFTPVLLPYSETFIRSHVEAFRRYRPVLTGLRRTDGLDLRGLETATIATGTRARFMLYWLGRSAELDRLIEEHGVKLVHCHFADASGLLAAYCRRRKIPLIVTIHGSDILRARQPTIASWLRHRLFRMARDTAALFLPVSNWLREEAIKLIPADKCVRHYLGIPLERRRSAPRPEGTVTILFVGRLVAKKGVPYLIDAVRELVASNYEFQVRIVGDGPLSGGARDAASTENLPITFTGALPPDHVRTEMDEADIFCLPSTQAPDGDNEGLGLVYLEAQSRSLPVVAFDQGPIPEAMIDGTTGILVPDKDPRALARALASLIADPARRRSMGEAGRQFVEERFDIARQAPKLEKLYDDVLADHLGEGGERIAAADAAIRDGKHADCSS